MSGEAASPAANPGESQQQTVGKAVFAAAFFMIFAGVFWGAADFSPEARLFPRLISIVAMVSAAILMVQSAQKVLATGRDVESVVSEAPPPSWRDLAISYAGPPLYCVLMAVLGFWIASAIFLGGLLVLLGTRRVSIVLFITAGTLSLIYVAFDLVFGIELPDGMLLRALGS